MTTYQKEIPPRNLCLSPKLTAIFAPNRVRVPAEPGTLNYLRQSPPWAAPYPALLDP